MKQRPAVQIKRTVQEKPIKVKSGEIVLPDVKYVAVMEVSEAKVFSGRTFSMPLCLFEYLGQTELKVFYFIMRHVREEGCCFTRNQTIANEICVSYVAISQAVNRMISMGILRVERDGNRKYKFIIWPVVQHLENISKKWKPGALTFLRERIGLKNLMDIPDRVIAEIKARYTISDDPIENEEYD